MIFLTTPGGICDRSLEGSFLDLKTKSREKLSLDFPTWQPISVYMHPGLSLDGWLRNLARLRWVFPKIGVGLQNIWFIMENLIKMDDLGVPLFSEHPDFRVFSCMRMVVTGFFSKKSPKGPTEQTPKPEYLVSSSNLL